MVSDPSGEELEPDARRERTIDALKDARDGLRRAASVEPNPRHATRYRYSAGRIDELIQGYRKTDAVIDDLAEREEGDQ